MASATVQEQEEAQLRIERGLEQMRPGKIVVDGHGG